MSQQNRWAPKPPFTSGGIIPCNTSPWIQVTYLTDPERIKALLPPVFEPGDRPEVYVRISDICYPEISYREMVGYIAVSAKYKGKAGEYPLLIPIDLESAVYISRETFGQPKVVAQLELTRNDNWVHARIARNGTTFIEINGEITGSLAVPAPYQTTQWWFKYLPAVSGKGFDAGPFLVESNDQITLQSNQNVRGTITLRDSATDPVADLPVRELVGMSYSDFSCVSARTLIGEVDPKDFEPYMHTRYFGVGE